MTILYWISKGIKQESFTDYWLAVKELELLREHGYTAWLLEERVL